MTQRKISQELYRNSGKSTTITVTPIREGDVLEVSKGGWSASRPASAKSGAKCSKIALGMERILLSKAMFLESDDKVYMEVEQSSGYVSALFDGEIIYASESLSPTSLSALIIAYLCRSGSEFTETSELIQKIKEEYDATGVVENRLIYSICDSAYYSWAKNKVISEDDCGIVCTTIQKGVDTGELRLHSVFDKNEFRNVTVESSAKTTASYPKSSIEEEFEAVKRGEWLIPFEWSEEAKKYIKPLDWLDTFAPTKAFFDVLERVWMSFNEAVELLDAGENEQRVLRQTALNTIICGAPGTGKSKLIAAVACATGVPYYNFSFSQETEKGNLIGQADINEEGLLRRIKTLLITWVQYGGIFSAEEFNLCSPNLLQGTLGQLLEEPFELATFSGDKICHRHPISAFCGSMNPEANGTNILNQAFVNRNPVVYRLDSIDENDFVKMVDAQYAGKFSPAQSKWAYRVLTTTLNYLNQSNVQATDIAMALSARTCFELLMQMREHPIRHKRKPYKDAINDTFVNTVYLYDKQIADDLKSALDATITPFPA